MSRHQAARKEDHRATSPQVGPTHVDRGVHRRRGHSGSGPGCRVPRRTRRERSTSITLRCFNLGDPLHVIGPDPRGRFDRRTHCAAHLGRNHRIPFARGGSPREHLRIRLSRY